MKRFFFDCGTRDVTASLGILALRVLIGLMMLIGHGIPKIENFAAKKASFYVPDFFPLNFMSPQISLMAAITAEVGAAALIILGFATRPASFVLAFGMVVAVFGFHGGDPWFSPGRSKELGLLYLIPLVSIIFSGAGLFSMDAALYQDTKRRRW